MSLHCGDGVVGKLNWICFNESRIFVSEKNGCWKWFWYLWCHLASLPGNIILFFLCQPWRVLFASSTGFVTAPGKIDSTTLRYKSSIPTQDLSSYIFQSLSVREWRIGDTRANLFDELYKDMMALCPILTQYHQEPTSAKLYWPITIKCQPVYQ